MSETTSAPVLLTVKAFCEKHNGWAKVGGIRHAIFFGDTNGFNECVVRFGRRILIDEARAFAWLRAHGEKLAPTRVA